MLTRLRTRWFAGGGALLLILALSGAAFGADSAGDSAAPPDADGSTLQLIVPNGSDCDTSTDDGASDADEADETETGDADEATESDESEVDENDQGENEQGDDACDVTDPSTPEADSETDNDTGTDSEDAAKADTPCVEVPAPPFDPAVFTGPGAFGAYVSSVAKSDAVGGKNCNHGGAVSEAVHAAKAAAKAARDAAKAERKATHDATKAAAKATRDGAKAQRAATHTNNGKGKGASH